MARHGGVALCAAVSPYRSTRNECRALVGGERFIEVFVNTPLEVCEARDTKGMYRQAREGKIKNFTGVDDPYEPPLRAELILDTIEHTAEENADCILEYLIRQGFILDEFNAPAESSNGEGEAPPRAANAVTIRDEAPESKRLGAKWTVTLAELSDDELKFFLDWTGGDPIYIEADEAALRPERPAHLEKLTRLGLVERHPTCRADTWYVVSADGIALQKLFIEGRINFR